MKKIFAYGTITPFGRLFQNRSTNQFFRPCGRPPEGWKFIDFPLVLLQERLFLTTPTRYFLAKVSDGFGLLPFRSPLLGEYYQNIIH